MLDADEERAPDAESDTAAASPAPAVTGPSSTPLLVAVGAAVLFAVVAVVLLVVLVRDRGHTDSSRDRTEISTTAARVAEAITAVDGSGQGSLGATVEALTTASVIEQYQEISRTISSQLTTLKLSSIRGTVKDVYVGNIDNAESRVIVRLDLVFVGDNTRVVPDQYLDMTLAKLDGTWKVDNVEVLNVKLENPAPTTPSTPAASAAPGASTPAPPPSSSS